MTQGVLQTDVYTDFQGLNALRGRVRTEGKSEQGQSEETLREVAGQFEALFLQMMLKSMREANLGEGMFDSEHTKTYQGMFDQQISLEMSRGRGIGLAEIMIQQLRRQQGGGDSELKAEIKPEASLSMPSRQSFPAVNQVQPGVPTEKILSTGTKVSDWAPESPQEFVRDLWPHAQRAAEKLGAKPELLVAQAALETGWGQRMIRGTDGTNSFNLFGIKAGTDWQGARATTETIEFRDGLMRKERAQFRAYASPEESFSDYVDFLNRNPRYSEALRQTDDAPAFTRALADAGYATDPDYAGKINRIMDSAYLQETASWQ
ncbi:Flagellar protein FlgJ [peptidoglycan hydrolase] [hydrothermal vent metagenome]|uniref:Peptidoglycan hydrolase FlgJ n=1 Tax=hydrothermal vent metagenome TaxID=652676 RepID=A0A3B0YHC5_9ZZZZ